MGNVAIRVENLGKMYRIGGPQERYSTFRDAITRAASAPFRKARDLLRGEAYGAAGLKEEIWALKDVSFEVKHGEVIGIIGRNGAGKSTLLKILSRITEPTTGFVDVYGRVGALLEVGTGFHPELTGRENVYLNGAILGMTRRDIGRKFDEIVDFAGVEKFIDTPVKHYSSGMGLRLGFSVAAHLEPDILVVDEVLAVGDAEFQKKCLGKMSDVAGQGRTVLFVSHNMAAVSSLCNTALLLNKGCITAINDTQSVLEQYQASTQFGSLNGGNLLNHLSRSGTGFIRLSSVAFLGPNKVNHFLTGQPCTIQVEYFINKAEVVKDLVISTKIKDAFGRDVFGCDSRYAGSIFANIPDVGKLACKIPQLPLLPGNYWIDLWCSVNGQVSDYIRDAASFLVVEYDYYGTGRLPDSYKSGPIVVDFEWKLVK